MITWLQKMHFLFSICHYILSGFRKHPYPPQEGGVSYQSKFIRQRGVAALGGIGYFLEPHILSSGRNVLSNHNTLNSLMKNPVAQETWLEKIRFQSPFFYTRLGHHKGTSGP